MPQPRKSLAAGMMLATCHWSCLPHPLLVLPPAEPYLMNCPCKMSLKYACVTMNSDYNNRLYGGRMLGTVSVPASSTAVNATCI